jgi:hypothetical protein
MNSTHISYSQRSGTTAESEVAALSNVFKFVLDCHAKKEAVPENRPDDGTKTKGDSADAPSLPY